MIAGGGAVGAHVRPRRSTGGGGARRTATSPPAPTRRGVASEPEEPVVDDEVRARHAPPRCADDGARRGCGRCRRCSPRCRSGVEVGTLVHRVLEATRLRRAGPRRRAGRRTSSAQARRARRHRRPRDAVVAGLRGGDRDAARADGRRCRLRDIGARRPPRRARLRAAAGRRRRRRAAALTLAAIADVLRAHSAPATRWPATPSACATRACARSVRGYLTGSIDLVAAARATASASRSSTTRPTGSASPGEDLTAWHYRPAALARRDDARPLPAAGAALHRRAAPLPALAAARLLRRSATSPACSTCSCAG